MRLAQRALVPARRRGGAPARRARRESAACRRGLRLLDHHHGRCSRPRSRSRPLPVAQPRTRHAPAADAPRGGAAVAPRDGSSANARARSKSPRATTACPGRRGQLLEGQPHLALPHVSEALRGHGGSDHCSFHRRLTKCIDDAAVMCGFGDHEHQIVHRGRADRSIVNGARATQACGLFGLGFLRLEGPSVQAGGPDGEPSQMASAVVGSASSRALRRWSWLVTIVERVPVRLRESRGDRAILIAQAAEAPVVEDEDLGAGEAREEPKVAASACAR